MRAARWELHPAGSPGPHDESLRWCRPSLLKRIAGNERRTSRCDRVITGRCWRRHPVPSRSGPMNHHFHFAGSIRVQPRTNFISQAAPSENIPNAAMAGSGLAVEGSSLTGVDTGGSTVAGGGAAITAGGRISATSTSLFSGVIEATGVCSSVVRLK